jgi:hypothetical protein
MDKVQLTLTIPQAQALAKALDLFTRLSIGQVAAIAEMVAMQEIPSYAENHHHERSTSEATSAIVREKIADIASALGYRGTGHSLGIGNTHVTIEGHRAYEISKVLDKSLAEHQRPNPASRGSRYDGLLVRYTADPAPEVRVIS